MSGAEQVVPEVFKLLENYGDRLQWIHVPDSRPILGSSGFPDFMIVGPGGILFRECKPHARTRMSTGQVRWRWMLTAAGANYGVWDVEDLADGFIKAELEAIL